MMNSYFYIPVFFIIATIYIKIAENFNIVDKPNHRSSHSTPTIRGGGILFYISILTFFFISQFQYPYFILGISLIAFVSFIDDIITLSSNVRLPFQFLAIGLCLFQVGLPINNLFVVIPLLIIGVGFINIYNFMDGINGITGLYTIVNLVFIYLINANERIINESLIVYVLISVIVFGFYNFRKKARMFSGDIGSISLAVLLFFIGVSFIRELEAPILILMMVVYGTDALITLAYRKFIGEKITEAHRKHIYQKMVHVLKIPHLSVAFIYTFFQLVINFVVYLYYKKPIDVQLYITILVISISVLLYYLAFKYIEKREIENDYLN
ncbi:glycosyltransferase family 4 protein [uncultured Tenacibaculum sp.]|uniref:MraY family glycosyltransferase n=1 Tax=uncultured Tenacibaculum sp. TaxID=174713 RepID=UPI0026293B2E|nr:glycosyltransferase family 4 protein [uncultured Tenacibaculum sp.]